MLVRQVMSKKVRTVTSDTSYADIIKLLNKYKISGVPVVNKKGKVIGVISEKDLFNKLFPSQKKFYKDPHYFMSFDNLEEDIKTILKKPARKIMTKEVLFVEPDDHVLKACSLFVRHRIRRLPVMKKGKLVGIVTSGNIYRNFLMHVI